MKQDITAQFINSIITLLVAAALMAVASNRALAEYRSARGIIYGNRAAQELCQFWVEKVERNSTIAQGWVVRHSHGLSGNKLGPGYLKYAKFFSYGEGNESRTKLVNWSWEVRDLNYRVARNPNINPKDKARRCEYNGKQANKSVLDLYDVLNPGNKIP